tara:strand:- start:317 stop:517 length:201 start_codon:yes stop_codon:yes gene_type:complete
MTRSRLIRSIEVNKKNAPMNHIEDKNSNILNFVSWIRCMNHVPTSVALTEATAIATTMEIDGGRPK